MFKILSKATYDTLHQQVANQTQRADMLELDVEELEQTKRAMEIRMADAFNRIETLEEENKRLLDLSVEAKDITSVTLQISDDLTSISPIVKWKPEIKEKLIETGYLNDVSATNMAVQVALMLIGQEAIEQIIENFQPEFKESV